MSGLLLPGRSEYRELTEAVNKELQTLCEQTDYLWFVDATAMTWDGQQYAQELFIKDGIHLNHDGQLRWMREYIQLCLRQVRVNVCKHLLFVFHAGIDLFGIGTLQ